MKPRPALDGLSIGYRRAKDFELHKSGAAKRTLRHGQREIHILKSTNSNPAGRRVAHAKGLPGQPSC
jgi:hypothetical protein